MEKINREAYLTDLITEYQNLVFSICYQYTGNYFEAEDLCQDTFLAAYGSLDSFDGKYEKAWLAQIASNKCKDFLKSAARRMEATADEELEQHETREPGPEGQVMEKDVRERLKLACESLKPPYQQVALLYYYQELEVNQIAESTGKNVKTIQTQIYRAREKLREIYGKEPVE